MTQAGSPYDVQPYAPGTTPRLPPAHGGIAILAWHAQQADNRYLAPPMVAVDGHTAFNRWGHFLVVVPPGEHQVEVRHDPRSRNLPVTVAASEVVELDYAVPAEGARAAKLGRSPQHPASFRISIGARLLIGILGLVGVVAAVVAAIVNGEPVILTFAVVALAIAAGGFFFARVKAGERLRDREKNAPK